MNSKVEKKAKAQVITKNVKVPTKVAIGNDDPLELIPGSGPLKDAIWMCISNGTQTVRYVFHHPIGVTDLDAGDWVLSTEVDIPYLVAHKSDPDAQRRLQIANNLRNAILVESGLLDEHEKKFFYPGTDVERSSLIVAAKKMASDYNKLELDKHIKLKKSKETFKEHSWEEFYDDEFVVMEQTIKDALRTDVVRERVEAGLPPPFRTVYRNDTPQCKVNLEGDITPGSLFDVIHKRMTAKGIVSMQTYREQSNLSKALDKKVSNEKPIVADPKLSVKGLKPTPKSIGLVIEPDPIPAVAPGKDAKAQFVEPVKDWGDDEDVVEDENPDGEEPTPGDEDPPEQAANVPDEDPGELEGPGTVRNDQSPRPKTPLIGTIVGALTAKAKGKKGKATDPAPPTTVVAQDKT